MIKRLARRSSKPEFSGPMERSTTTPTSSHPPSTQVSSTKIYYAASLTSRITGAEMYSTPRIYRENGKKEKRSLSVQGRIGRQGRRSKRRRRSAENQDVRPNRTKGQTYGRVPKTSWPESPSTKSTNTSQLPAATDVGDVATKITEHSSAMQAKPRLALRSRTLQPRAPRQLPPRSDNGRKKT